MIHDKTGLLHLASMMADAGIKHLVVSPGSRNAPIVKVFCSNDSFNCHTIVDERSAAFFALGMALQLKKPVAIACTSGTAALNYAPAIAEAFYQRIPLVVLTADRPVEWVDQGDGQTIRQSDVFKAHVRESVQLPQQIRDLDDLWFNDRLISQALNAAVFPVNGPVHINLPFREPLYGFDTQLQTRPKIIRLAEIKLGLPEQELNYIKSCWANSQRKMLLIGQLPQDALFESVIKQLSDDPSVVILTETTSNIYGNEFIGCIDRTLAAIKIKGDFQPDLLITVGGPVVSKKIKAFLRESPIAEHWNIDLADLHTDTYQHLNRVFPMQAIDFLQILTALPKGTEGSFRRNWHWASQTAAHAHLEYLSKCAYSDLQIFDEIINHLPPDMDIHLANSTPIRYAQLFDYRFRHRFDSNRGTSGIDGSLSTAAGAVFISQKPGLFITGDLGFFYDSNGLWNRYLSPHLRIILINNGGGSIFRIIEGPEQSGLLENYFEAAHQTSARGIAQSYGLDYLTANDLDGLKQALTEFFIPTDRAVLLEVQSPAEQSAETLKMYFRAISNF